jgi:hypothetical protein
VTYANIPQKVISTKDKGKIAGFIKSKALRMQVHSLSVQRMA